MDIQKMFDAIDKATSDVRKRYHVQLGELIESLKSMPDAKIKDRRLYSYRGYYSDLALVGKEEDCEWVSASDFLPKLEEAVGKTFVGYKGGDFVMDEETPLWLSNERSRASGEAIIGLKIDQKADGTYVWFMIKEVQA